MDFTIYELIILLLLLLNEWLISAKQECVFALLNETKTEIYINAYTFNTYLPL